MPNHPSDPRPDITADHKHWEDLLYNCWHLEQPLYYLLHGIRCGGAQVTTTQESFMLLPGEWNEDKWEDIKQNRLNPFREKLIDIFRLTRIGKFAFDLNMPEQFSNQQALADNSGQMDMFNAG